jgi:hypothetical protein
MHTSSTCKQVSMHILHAEHWRAPCRLTSACLQLLQQLPQHHPGTAHLVVVKALGPAGGGGERGYQLEGKPHHMSWPGAAARQQCHRLRRSHACMPLSAARSCWPMHYLHSLVHSPAPPPTCTAPGSSCHDMPTAQSQGATAVLMSHGSRTTCTAPSPTCTAPAPGSCCQGTRPGRAPGTLQTARGCQRQVPALPPPVWPECRACRSPPR